MSAAETAAESLGLTTGSELAEIMRKKLLGSEDPVVPRSNLEPTAAEVNKGFATAGTLDPCLDPLTLVRLFGMSNALRQNIDTMVQNVHGGGHAFEPILDFDSDEAWDRVKSAMIIERERQAELEADDDEGPEAIDEPSDQEVNERVEELKAKQWRELVKAKAFFDFANRKISFVRLRKKVGGDVETVGFGCWEVLRDKRGEPRRLNYASAWTFRAMPADDPIEVDTRIRVTDITWETEKEWVSFRRFVQISEVGMEPRYFKEYGDPRVMSRESGKFYESVEDMEKAEEKPHAATELLWFKLDNPESDVYGLVRWSGAVLSAIGSREMEEVNLLFFENKAIPPLVVLVSGGHLAKQAKRELKQIIRDHVKGKDNFHRILILEAEPAKPGAQLTSTHAQGTVRIELKPLTDAIFKDQLWGQYDEANRHKVGESFRIPPLLRGVTRDFNRACYDEETETLTENGWKRLGEFVSGEKIAAYDKEAGSVEFVVPEALHVYDVDEDLLHFEAEHTDIMVTEDHSMLVSPVKRDGSRSWGVHKSHEIPWTRYAFLAATESFTGSEQLEFALPKDNGCQIERKHHHKPISMDDFLQFLGYWVSEGSLLETDHPISDYLVTLAQRGGPVADRIQECLRRIGWGPNTPMVDKEGYLRWHISNRCLRAWLKEHCGSKSAEKHLPRPLISTLSARQLRILFDALVEGDGTLDKRTGRTSGSYSTTSRRLADDVHQLAVLLGYRSTVGLHYEANGNRQTCWRVGFSGKKEVQIRQPPKRVAYRGRVYCFSVPTHGFFVTRRNGKVAIQGNTASAALKYADDQIFQPERDEFDHEVNRTLLPDLGITLWRFVSKAPRMADPEALLDKIAKLVESIMSPEEARRFVARALGIELAKIEAPWARVPMRYGLAGLSTEADEESEGEEQAEQDETEKGVPVDVLRIPQDRFDRLIGASE